MRPETRRRIEEVMQEYPASDAGDLVACARGALLASKPGGVTSADILRAIAYLVRRLELDAPAPEQAQAAPAGAIRKGAVVYTLRRGAVYTSDAWGRRGGAHGEVLTNPEDSICGDVVSVKLGDGSVLPYLVADLELVSTAPEQGRDEPR
jgi:hypothetical protein